MEAIYPTSRALTLPTTKGSRRYLWITAKSQKPPKTYYASSLTLKLSNYSSKIMETKSRGRTMPQAMGFGLSDDKFWEPQVGMSEECATRGMCSNLQSREADGNSSLAGGDINEITKPVSNPIKVTWHIQILKGNLAPEGSVAKITGKEGTYFSGPALVFEGLEAMIAAISENPSSFKGKVIVIRGEGPKGRPGMPEMLTPTTAVMGAGLGKDVALLTDGRFSGGSHGFVVGQIRPEAQEGGPIGLIRNGDLISIDVRKRAINVELTDAELNERRKNWNPLPYKANRGVSHKLCQFHGNAYDIVSGLPVNIRRACQLVGAFVTKVLLFQPNWNLYAIDVPASVMGTLAATLMAKVMAKQPLVLCLILEDLARRWTVDFVKYICRQEGGD